jgi:hypothetical protein
VAKVLRIEIREMKEWDCGQGKSADGTGPLNDTFPRHSDREKGSEWINRR